jgi:hypothetical protein
MFCAEELRWRKQQEGGCGRPHNWRMRWVGNVERMGDMTNAYKVLDENSEGKRKRKWEDNIRMDLREIICEVVDWIRLT